MPRSTSPGRAVLGGRALAVVLAGVGLLLAVPGTAVSGPSGSSPGIFGTPAATSGACPTLDDGVTVVVDFRGVGGRGTVVRCAPGSPADGYAVLRGAGFSIDLLSNGFVCRIDGLPAPPGEPCQGTGAASTEQSWSYSLAERGGSWSLATRGAMRPARTGEVQGWALAAGGTPSVPPPPPPPPPTTAPPPPPTTAPAAPPAPAVPGPPPPAAPAPPPAAGPPAPDGTAGGNPPGPAPPVEADDDAGDDAAEDADEDAHAGSTTTRRPTTTAPATTTTEDEGLEGAMTVEIRSDDGGPGAAGLVVGTGLIAGLGAVAALQTRRRRSAAAAAEAVGGT